MQPLKLRNWHFLMLIKGRSSLIWKCGILRNWHLKLDNMPKSALKDAFLQWHFLRFIYFNFEKLTTFKTTIRNKLLRNSSWIRLCLGLPLPHYVILISNIIWDHVVDIFCVLIFPRLFKWTFATFVFGVHSFVCIAGEQPFVSNCSSTGVLTVWFCLFFSEKSMNFRWTKKRNSHFWIYSHDKNKTNQKGYFLCWMNVREDGISFSDPT